MNFWTMHSNKTKMARAEGGSEKWGKRRIMDSKTLWCQKTCIWEWLSKSTKLNSTIVRRERLRLRVVLQPRQSFFFLFYSFAWLYTEAYIEIFHFLIFLAQETSNGLSPRAHYLLWKTQRMWLWRFMV